MKLKSRYLMIALILTTLVFTSFTSCTKKIPVAPETTEEGMKGLVVDPSFNWSTTKKVDFQIVAKDNSNEPLPYVRLDIMDGDPDEGGNPIVSGATDDQGVLSLSATVPTGLESVCYYIGLPNKIQLEVAGDAVTYTFGEGSPLLKPNSSDGSFMPKSHSTYVDDYIFLGNWNEWGVPDYLEVPGDNVDAELLADINASLPERKTILESHPEYLANGNETNVRLRDDCDMWVTFVHEGARWLNGLGFYTYDLDTPPTSVEDIKSITIIFPNVSFKYSGGGLKTGDKVNI